MVEKRLTKNLFSVEQIDSELMQGIDENSTRVGSCPSHEVLVAMMTGDVPPDEIDGIFEHIQSCSLCETKLGSITASNDEITLRRVVLEVEGELQAETTPTVGLNSTDQSLSAIDLLDDDTGSSIPATSKLTKIGKYKILELIAEGGFGRVYKGFDRILKRTVAIKIPRPDRFTSKRQKTEFLNEARTIARLDHRNIVPIYEADISDDGLIFIAMKWIDGCNLKDDLQKATSIEYKCKLMAKICSAVNFAHQQGFVHRDLKPANILIDKNGEPYVADFGLAVHEKNLAGRRGEFAGTVAYMSPEQILGKVDIIDGRTDVWSLGIILYEMLAKRRPFVGDNESMVSQIIDKTPNPIKLYWEDVPQALESVCLQAIEKQPANRTATANEISKQLSEYINKLQAGRVPINAGSLVFKMSALAFAALAFIALMIMPSLFGWFGTGTKNANADANSISDTNQQATETPEKQEESATVWKIDPVYFPEKQANHWKLKNGVLQLVSNSKNLLVLKRDPPADFELTVEFFQSSWSGNVGVVLAFDGDSYQKIQFCKSLNSKYYVTKELITLKEHPADGPSDCVASDFVSIVDGDIDPGDFMKFTIAVRGKRIVVCELNDKPLTEITNDQTLIDQGAIGIFIGRAEATIKNITLNDEPITLFSD